jgi:hypothetical protein
MPFQLSAVANNTAKQFTNTSLIFYNGIRLKSDPDNTNRVAIGIVGTPASNALTVGTNNTSTDGWKMAPGDELAIPVSMAADLSKIWIIAAGGSQEINCYGS